MLLSATTKRPLPITIISWYLILGAAMAVFTIHLALNDPAMQASLKLSSLSLSIQVAMMAVGSAVALACGIAMLMARDWSRWVYVAWTAISLTLSVATSPVTKAFIPSLLIVAVVIFFLFRPAANVYFRGTPDDAAGT